METINNKTLREKIQHHLATLSDEERKAVCAPLGLFDGHYSIRQPVGQIMVESEPGEMWMRILLMRLGVQIMCI